MQNSTPEKLLMSARETARMLSVCEKTLWSMSAPRGPIPVVRIGTRCLYAVKSLQAYIDAQTGDGPCGTNCLNGGNSNADCK